MNTYDVQIIAALRATLPKPTPFEDLLKLGMPEAFVQNTLQQLSRNGDVMEVKPGYWLLLE